MSILVTGGAGFIGSHACQAFHAAGLTPVTYDNLSTGHRDAVKWGPFEHGDIRDAGRLLEVLKQHRCTAIVHFAAVAYVGESVRQPGKYFDINVSGTLALLRAMREAGVERLVFSSSCATYGIPDSGLIDEGSHQSPINPYGRSKLMCEQIIDDHVAAYGLGAIHLRYFNAAGSDPSLTIGERHDPETHLIPLTIGAAMGKRPPLEIFGTDYPTRDGTCIRDYIHVCDLADAHLKAIDRCVARESHAFNLGAGTGTSVRELIEVVDAIAGRPTPTKLGARRPGDPPELVANIGKAKSGLGWSPQRSSIGAVVRDAWAWAELEARG